MKYDPAYATSPIFVTNKDYEFSTDLDNPQPKNTWYDKRDFIARKHGKEREPWVQKPMPFPPKSTKKKMMKNLNALLKWLGQYFCVPAWLIS